MAPDPDLRDLRSLVDDVCTETASEDSLDSLGALLPGNKAAQQFYLKYCRLHAELYLACRGQQAHKAVLEVIRSRKAPPPSPSPVVFLASAVHGTVGYFSSGWPLAYLIATLIFGAALLIGSLVPVSEPEQVARQSVLPSPLSTLPSIVGRITGMVDCQFDGSKAQDPRPKTLVALGDKFALASGLMEITYDTGAKVILQGPVTYEVESKDSGFLSLGKLTARVEGSTKYGVRRTETANSGQWPVASDNQQSSNPQSPIPHRSSLSALHSPLFTIKTPTATVTDLGTEFGVETAPGGVTKTHVFAGHVRVTAMGGRNGGSEGLLLWAGQDAICDGNSPTVQIVASSLGASGQFVRTLASPSPSIAADAYADFVLSLRPVVYYRMEPPKDGKDRNVVFDSAPGHHHGVLHFSDRFVGAPYVSGRFGHALLFRGPMVGDYVIVPDYPKATGGRLTVSVWALLGGRMEGWPAIVNNWSYDEHGRPIGQFNLCLFRDIGDLTSQVTAQSEIREGSANEFPLGVWQHVAMVADGTNLHVYRNGTEVASGPATDLPRQDLVSGLGIGCWMNRTGTDVTAKDPCYWLGRIDEFAIFNEALSAEQVRQLYTGPVPTGGARRSKSSANKNGTGAKP